MTQPERLRRRLVAILYGDVTGYTRLTAEGEDATHRRLSEYLDFIAATVRAHQGRVMHYAGDAVLARFDAVVDALACAAAVQRELGRRNANLPVDRRVEFEWATLAQSAVVVAVHAMQQLVPETESAVIVDVPRS